MLRLRSIRNIVTKTFGNLDGIERRATPKIAPAHPKVQPPIITCTHSANQDVIRMSCLSRGGHKWLAAMLQPQTRFENRDELARFEWLKCAH